MVLDFVNKSFLDAGSTSAIQRFFIDMPLVTKKICMIRQVRFMQIELSRVVSAYDTRFAMSADPDHVLTSMVILDSTMFLAGSWQNVIVTSIGRSSHPESEKIFMYPEGIKCPYTRLPVFIQHSNTNSATTNWNVMVFYELLPISAQDLAVAVLRRGRGQTRD